MALKRNQPSISLPSEPATRRANTVEFLASIRRYSKRVSDKISHWVRAQINESGVEALRWQLRLCGAIPEQFSHDSTAEKIYSKYTDVVLSESFNHLQLNSSLYEQRGDSADVMACTADYTLVADAKAFRLSRSAKNQKDFKIQALDGWRGQSRYAVLVGPIYQMPVRTSQVYRQAVTCRVCVLSYSHISALLGLPRELRAESLQRLLSAPDGLNPGKSAADYWSAVNGELLRIVSGKPGIWAAEKRFSMEALEICKTEALVHLRTERERLLRLPRREAINELIRAAGIVSRIHLIDGVSLGNLLEL